MNQEELEAKIDAFLWDLLPDAERELIEKEINNNPDFRAKMAVRQFEHRLLERMEKESLAAKMKTWEEEAAVPEKSTPEVAVAPTPMTPVYRKRRFLSRPMQWAMAATVALLVTVGVGYFRTKTQSDGVQFAYNLKERADTMFFPKIANNKFSAGNDPKDSADIYFKAGEFDKTIAVYDDYFAQLSEMRQNTEGSSLGDSTQQKAEWQLVLTYQVARKPMDERVTKLLNRMAQNPEHRFHRDAQELQQKMNGFWRKYVN